MDADVAVIGAGIVGLATAYELQRSGREVLLLEADRPGARQSGGDARIFRLAHERAEHVRQAIQAREGWQRWESELGRELLQPCGLVCSGADAARRRAEVMRQAGARPEELEDPGELAVALPGRPSGTLLFDRQAGAVRLADAVRALAEPLAPQTQLSAARAVHQGGGTVRIETDGRTWTAADAIVCAGIGTQPLAREAGLELPGVWRRHTRFTYAPRSEGGPWAAWIHSAPEGGFYALPVPGGAYAVGISGHRGEPLVEASSREEWHDRARGPTDRMVEQHMPALDPSPVASEDCCYLDSPDIGHDGTRIHEQGRVRWVMAVNVAKMAPEVGARLAGEMARV